MVARLRRLSAELTKAVATMSEAEIDTPYRDGGWTVRQVIHHLADAHLNGYLRSKLILTEDRPVLKSFDQEAWAATPEIRRLPVAVSLGLIQTLHERWAILFNSLGEADWARAGLHPKWGEMTLGDQLALISRHGDNHLRQILLMKNGR